MSTCEHPSAKGRASRGRVPIVVTGIAVMLGAAGCGNATSSPATGSARLAAEQVLHINSFFQPPSFDPGRDPGAFGPSALIRQYVEPLLGLTADAKGVRGAAAQSYEVSSDGLTYTFHLRSDGRYNDGQPVKAQDFVYGWRRLLDPRLAAPLADTFSLVRGAGELAALDPKADAAKIGLQLTTLGLAAPDDLTFRVTLAYAAPYFKFIAAIPAGAPIRQDVVEKYGFDRWASKPETLVTNGPFRVAERVTGQSVTLVRNPYFRQQPRLATIVAYQLSGSNVGVAWNKYLNNEIDISNGPPGNSVVQALSDPVLGKQVLQYDEPSESWLTFNTKKAPFDNPKVRLAFTEAIDRRAYVQDFSRNLVEPLSGLIPRGIPGYDRRVGTAESFNPDRAKALLASSGVAPSTLAGIHILTRNFTSKDTQFVQDQIQRNLGVTMTIDAVEDASTQLSRGNFQVYGPDYAYGAAYPDPRLFMDQFLTGSTTTSTGWSDPGYDRLVRQADATTDSARRLFLYQQAEEMLLAQAPVAVFSQTKRLFWIKPWVKGIVSSPFDDADFPGDLFVGDIYIAQH